MGSDLERLQRVHQLQARAQQLVVSDGNKPARAVIFLLYNARFKGINFLAKNIVRKRHRLAPVLCPANGNAVRLRGGPCCAV